MQLLALLINQLANLLYTAKGCNVKLQLLTCLNKLLCCNLCLLPSVQVTTQLIIKRKLTASIDRFGKVWHLLHFGIITKINVPAFILYLLMQHYHCHINIGSMLCCTKAVTKHFYRAVLLYDFSQKFSALGVWVLDCVRIEQANNITSVHNIPSVQQVFVTIAKRWVHYYQIKTVDRLVSKEIIAKHPVALTLQNHSTLLILFQCPNVRLISVAWRVLALVSCYVIKDSTSASTGFKYLQVTEVCLIRLYHSANNACRRWVKLFIE